MHKVEELKIWQKSIELTKLVYQLIKQLPSDEKYGLLGQIKRSVVSIPSNIAEGAGRNSKKEFKYFLNIANGSSYELQTQLIILSELGFIAKEEMKSIHKLLNEILKMNFALQRSID
ncbi:MAG: four helix bundle protein [Flavobacteriia bacterium]|nr:MAG: four helix bundle protein [Flavobacteriia bacterium]